MTADRFAIDLRLLCNRFKYITPGLQNSEINSEGGCIHSNIIV